MATVLSLQSSSSTHTSSQTPLFLYFHPVTHHWYRRYKISKIGSFVPPLPPRTPIPKVCWLFTGTGEWLSGSSCTCCWLAPYTRSPWHSCCSLRGSRHSSLGGDTRVRGGLERNWGPMGQRHLMEKGKNSPHTHYPNGTAAAVLTGKGHPSKGNRRQVSGRGKDLRKGPTVQGHPMSERWGLHREPYSAKERFSKGQEPLGFTGTLGGAHRRVNGGPARHGQTPRQNLCMSPPLPPAEPHTHSCGSCGSGSSCTCRTRRRSRSHLGQQSSRQAGTGPGPRRGTAGHGTGTLTGGTRAVLGIHGLAWLG